MAKINCRETNMCMFCKYWLGKKPAANLITGDVKISPGKGLCSMDNTNKNHDPDGLCYMFKKNILYC